MNSSLEIMQDAYHGYLDICNLSIQALRENPGFESLKQCREALNKAEEILLVLAKNDCVHISSKKPSLMVIPVSKYSKKYNVLKQLQKDADDKYELALKESVDLKLLRDLLQSCQVTKLQYDSISSKIKSIEKMRLIDWDCSLFAFQVAYLSKSLFASINIGSEVLIPSIERMSTSLQRFFAFQEFLFVIMMSASFSKEDLLKFSDFMIGVTNCLIFNEHDIASASILLEVLASLNLASYSSPSSKSQLSKLLDLFGNGSFEIHLEITQDMVAAHPVTDCLSCIVPNLEKIVKASAEIYGKAPMSDSDAKVLDMMATLLTQCQSPGSFDDCNSDKVNLDCIHWILSRPYADTLGRNFWKELMSSLPTILPQPLPPTKLERVENNQEVTAENDDQSDALLRRFHALRKS